MNAGFVVPDSPLGYIMRCPEKLTKHLSQISRHGCQPTPPRRADQTDTRILVPPLQSGEATSRAAHAVNHSTSPVAVNKVPRQTSCSQNLYYLIHLVRLTRPISEEKIVTIHP